MEKLNKVKNCNHCGKEVVEISTKSADYKAVCLHCEITYKLKDGVLIEKNSNAHQLTEAMMNN